MISTFTSPQEREALRRALAKKKRLIAVFPAGIPATLSPALDAAVREGRALAVSPQPPDSRLNKKIATWCNEFVLRNADEIWVGDIAPNGMLAQMLAALLKTPAPPEASSLSKGATFEMPAPPATSPGLARIAPPEASSLSKGAASAAPNERLTYE